MPGDLTTVVAAGPCGAFALYLADRAHVERCFDRTALAREYRKIIETAGGRR